MFTEKPSKSNLIIETRQFVFADSAAEQRSSVGILNVFMLVNVGICLSVYFWPLGGRSSNFSVGMHPCNCRGQSMMTPRLPGGSKVSRSKENQWRQPRPTGMTPQFEHYIELDSPTKKEKKPSFIPIDLLTS